MLHRVTVLQVLRNLFSLRDRGLDLGKKKIILCPGTRSSPESHGAPAKTRFMPCYSAIKSAIYRANVNEPNLIWEGSHMSDSIPRSKSFLKTCLSNLFLE